LYGIAQGIAYLHSKKIVHGDIKGVSSSKYELVIMQLIRFQANILIDDLGLPLLADFGLTVFADVTRQATTDHGGTVRYMAPELLFPQHFGMSSYKRTTQTDIYSFACVCIEVGLLIASLSERHLTSVCSSYTRERSPSAIFKLN
jgi:serine/threonine protein kinase